MALRKYYYKLKIKEGQPLEFTTTELMAEVDSNNYYRPEYVYEDSMDTICTNINPIGYYSNYKPSNYYGQSLGIDLDTFYPDVFLLSMVYVIHIKSYPDSSIEFCPSFNNYTALDHTLELMIRYYDEESVENFESILYKYFDVESESYD